MGIRTLPSHGGVEAIHKAVDLESRAIIDLLQCSQLSNNLPVIRMEMTNSRDASKTLGRSCFKDLDIKAMANAMCRSGATSNVSSNDLSFWSILKRSVE